MKEKILNIIYNLNYSFLLRNIILLESNPDFMDNTKAIFDEMIKQKLNEKFKIIWLIDINSDFKNVKIKNVKFIKRKKSSLKYKYYRYFSKYIVDCNKYIYKKNKNQFRIHLTHGAPLKVAREYASNSGDFDYIIQLSEVFNKTLCDIFNTNEEKIRVIGYPRNDYLFSKCEYFKNMFLNGKYKKLIVWMPTYRNHKIATGFAYRTSAGFKYGVPTVENEKELYELNEELDNKEILLLIKLHPVEDCSKIKELSLSNIRVISDNKIFEEKRLTIYHLLSISDALITDYSSIYYDYLLTDKPIGLAIPDIDEYSKHVQLQFDNYEENIAGEYIYTFDDLIKFIKNVADENDISYVDRMNKKKIYHKYTDDNSSKRVLKILTDKMREEEKK